MNFSDKLKQARAAADMSQERLGAATGISRRSIAEYETNPDIQVRKKNLHRIAKALDVSYEYLANDEITDPHYCADAEAYIEQVRGACGDEEAKNFAEMLQKEAPLFAGGTLNDEARDRYYQALANAYVHINERAAKKYGRKRKIYK